MEEALQIAARSVLAILALFVLTKMMGKRQLTQMTFFEYAVGITIGSLAGKLALEPDVKVINGLTSMTSVALLVVLFEMMAFRNKTARHIVDGETTVLIKNGHILEQNLKRVRMTPEELMQHLRLKNAFQIADVEFAMMELSGQVSVLLKEEKQPPTALQLGMKVQQKDITETVIVEGRVLEDALAYIGHDRQWLDTQLQKRGLTVDQIYLAQVNANQQLTYDLYH
jgi:uncharacterized membrane protein YcaP (DUF421 family)